MGCGGVANGGTWTGSVLQFNEINAAPSLSVTQGVQDWAYMAFFYRWNGVTQTWDLKANGPLEEAEVSAPDGNTVIINNDSTALPLPNTVFTTSDPVSYYYVSFYYWVLDENSNTWIQSGPIYPSSYDQYQPWIYTYNGGSQYCIAWGGTDANS